MTGETDLRRKGSVLSELPSPEVKKIKQRLCTGIFASERTDGTHFIVVSW